MPVRLRVVRPGGAPVNVEPSCVECADRGWTLRYGQVEPCRCGTYDPPRWVTNGDRPCLLEHHKDPNRPRRASVGWLCSGHYARFTQHLADLPALYDDLGEVLTASERHDSEQGSVKNGAKSAGLNLNEPIVEARRELHDECVRMARDIAETRGIDLPTDDTVAALAWWLAGQADWMAEQDDADDTYRYLDTMVTAAQRLAFPSGRRKFTVGTCETPQSCDVETRTIVRCPGAMQAILTPSKAMEFPDVIRCDTCGLEVPSPGWYRWGQGRTA